LFVKERKSVENERAMEKIAKRTQKRDLQTEAAMAIGKKKKPQRNERDERKGTEHFGHRPPVDDSRFS
jgi:hypothetical protein